MDGPLVASLLLDMALHHGCRDGRVRVGCPRGLPSFPVISVTAMLIAIGVVAMDEALTVRAAAATTCTSLAGGCCGVC
jgi:hypothetical protein